MKSKFFKDTQELECAFDVCAPDKLCVCVRLSKRAYEQVLHEANRLEISSGEYIERVVLARQDPQYRLH